jgi:hypothetical protein
MPVVGVHTGRETAAAAAAAAAAAPRRCIRRTLPLCATLRNTLTSLGTRISKYIYTEPKISSKRFFFQWTPRNPVNRTKRFMCNRITVVIIMTHQLQHPLPAGVGSRWLLLLPPPPPPLLLLLLRRHPIAIHSSLHS